MVVPSSTEPPALAGQAKYEVRFDWARDGVAHVAQGVGVIVIVDALPSVDELVSSPQGSEKYAAASRVWEQTSTLAALAAEYKVPVLRASLRNRSAIARWVLARQQNEGERIRVAVIATGETRDEGGTRFAVEDMLAAGAVIDALAEVGIDYCSPEAAAACASYTGLRRAMRHLLSASETGIALLERDARDAVAFAGEVDGSDDVPVLTDGVFRPGEFRAPA